MLRTGFKKLHLKRLHIFVVELLRNKYLQVKSPVMQALNFQKPYFITTLVILMLLCGIYSPVLASETFKITDADMDNSTKIFMLTGNGLSGDMSVRSVKISNPDRIVVDIQNAAIIIPRQSFDINNFGIKNIKFAQFSANPNVVRIVITGDSFEDLKKIKLMKQNNSLVFKLDNIEQQEVTDLSPVYFAEEDNTVEDSKLPATNAENSQSSDKIGFGGAPNIVNTSNVSDKKVDNSELALLKKAKFVINTVRFDDGQLVISGIGSLTVKEPFVLENPKRLVFDLPNSIPRSLNQTSKDILFKNGDRVRIAQFNEKTTRIVINTKTPDVYKRVITPELQSLIISPYSNLNLSSTPFMGVKSDIKKISVDKIDDKTTTVKINASAPLLHNIKKLDDKLILELYNLQISNPAVIKKLPVTNQFKGIELAAIKDVKSGASLVIPLKTGSITETKLSADGQTMELKIKNNSVYAQIPTGAKVVIDAGHGGSDCGAIGEKIFEKDVTLDIAKRLKAILESAGVQTVMTRVDDSFVSLQDRTAVTNNANPNIFVSVHVNSCESSTVVGLETHWYNSADSQELAQTVQDSISGTIKSLNRGTFKSKFYVINHTSVPAILVEVGFISNTDERSQMLTDDRKNKTAQSIAKGIFSYLEKYKK